MKRAFVMLLCFALTAGMFSGCGNAEDEVQASTEIESDGKGEEPEETENDIAADKTESEEEELKEEMKEKDSEEAEDSDEEEDLSKDLTMTVLKDNADSIDYTSLKEINLEPASYIAVVVKNTKTGYWSTVKKGMEKAVEDLNNELGYKGDDKIKMSFEGPGDETDVDAQINIIDAVLMENPSVLCLAAIDMDSCQPQLEAANDNEIPVIVLDSGVASGEVNAFCATDNRAAGAEAARKLAEAIDGEGQIAVMTHLENAESSQDREEGFTDEIEKNYPDIEIVNISHENEESSMKDMAKSVLTLFPDLKGYYATNETSASEVLDALEESEKDIVFVGFDAGKKQKEAIENGKELGVIAQNPYGMGYATIVAAARAEANLENDAFIHSGYQWIDSSSLEDEIYKNYLYE